MAEPIPPLLSGDGAPSGFFTGCHGPREGAFPMTSPRAVGRALGLSRLRRRCLDLEEELRRERSRSAAIVEALTDPLFVVDGDGFIRYGHVPEEASFPLGEGVVGHRVEEFLEAEELERHYRTYRRCLSSGEVESFSGTFSVEGRHRSYRARFSPVEDGSCVALIRDVTGEREAESRLACRAAELERHQEAIIGSMAILAESRDGGTGAHIERTKAYVRLLLEASGAATLYPPEHVDLVWQSAALHDVGKVGVPDAILLKPGRLTKEEFDVIKQHPLIGARILERVEAILGKASFIPYAREIVEYHHERWDGTGYPHGLEGEAIPFSARLMAVADVYDALVTERPYHEPMAHDEALSVIVGGAGSHFDPAVVALFLSCADRFGEISRSL